MIQHQHMTIFVNVVLYNKSVILFLTPLHITGLIDGQHQNPKAGKLHDKHFMFYDDSR